MLKRIAVVLSTLTLAFFILGISVFNSTSPRVFSASPKPTTPAIKTETETTSDYIFVYPGGILPDSPFWYLKAIRDRIWLIVTTNPMRKAELSLLFADKRIMTAQKLFENNKPQLALSTLTKAEKYLQNAADIEARQRKGGVDTKSFLMTLAKASLAHITKIKELLSLAPDDVRPEMVKAGDYSRSVFQQSRSTLESYGMLPPKNPFEGK